MLLFGLNEYLRSRFYPSAIVVVLTDIDNPQEKLAGYLESRIFPGYASALENRGPTPERVGLNSFLVSSSLISCRIEHRDFRAARKTSLSWSCYEQYSFCISMSLKYFI